MKQTKVSEGTENKLITRDDQHNIRSDLLPTSVSQIISHYQQYPSVVPILQSETATQFYKHSFQSSLIAAQESGDKMDAARLLAVSADGASLWKTTIPETDQTTLSDVHYQIAAKIALGIAPLSLPSDCNSCHKTNACADDPIHPLNCAAQKGKEITLRHNGVVNDLQHGVITTGGVSQKEPTHLSSNGDQTRPDLQVVISGKQYLVDVTVRNPTAPTYYEMKDGSAEQQLKSTEIAEQQKNNKYSAMAKAQGAKFIPFAVEMYGGWGKSAKHLLNLIYKSNRDQSLVWPYQHVMENIKGNIAISIQRGNAIAILQAHNRAVGHVKRGGSALTA